MTHSAPGIFNVLDDWGVGFGMVANDSTKGAKNAQALQAAINAAQAYCANSPPGGPAYGAIILIPSNSEVPISGSPASEGVGGEYFLRRQSTTDLYAVTIDCQYPLLFVGTGNGSVLHMLEAFDIFLVNNGQIGMSTNAGGISFQDLKIRYANNLSLGAAIHVLGGSQNPRVYRTVFVNCPISIWFEDSRYGSVIDVTVANPDNPGIAIQLGSESFGAFETYISGCVIGASGKNTPGTGIGLLVLQATQLRVSSLRIEGYQQSIVICAAAQTSLGGPGASNLFFKNVTAFATSPSVLVGGALLIQPGNGAAVTRAAFVDCTLDPTLGTKGGTEYSGPGIYLDESYGGTIDQIRFISCFACTWLGPGIQINGGSNVEIIGGSYSCNAVAESLPTDAPPPAGIAITAGLSGAPFGGSSYGVNSVRIVGAACNNSFYEGGNLSSVFPGPEPATQQYGIFIMNGGVGTVSNVLIASCDLSGNLAYAVGIDAFAESEDFGVIEVFIRRCNLAGSAINAVQILGNPTAQITDCAGYNDQGKIIAIVPPMNGSVITNTAYQYYGPVAFYVSQGTVSGVTIDGRATGLTSGGFTLGPGESGAIQYSVAPAFLMVGK
jgi:hypothetical protein